MKGVTGLNLLRLLELRLDNVVYRLGFAASRPLARQLVRHMHIEVNGKITSIPSYKLNPGQIVSVTEKAKELENIHNSLRSIGENIVPWLQLEKAKLSGKVLSEPAREEIPTEAQEQLIVEYYSR
jgi:small subunit ribosomal protein S4